MIFPILGSRYYRFITPELFYYHRESRTCPLYLYPYYRYSAAEVEAEAGHPSVLGRICTYLLHLIVPDCKVMYLLLLTSPRHFLPELSRESFQYSELSSYLTCKLTTKVSIRDLPIERTIFLMIVYPILYYT